MWEHLVLHKINVGELYNGLLAFGEAREAGCEQTLFEFLQQKLGTEPSILVQSPV